jgi:hypothetical protein
MAGGLPGGTTLESGDVVHLREQFGGLRHGIGLAARNQPVQGDTFDHGDQLRGSIARQFDLGKHKNVDQLDKPENGQMAMKGLVEGWAIESRVASSGSPGTDATENSTATMEMSS